jgi:hypothetical protein
MSIYHRKLYALLKFERSICENLECLRAYLPDLDTWWEQGELARQIASSSDRVNYKHLEIYFPALYFLPLRVENRSIEPSIASNISLPNCIYASIASIKEK